MVNICRNNDVECAKEILWPRGVCEIYIGFGGFDFQRGEEFVHSLNQSKTVMIINIASI